MAVDWLLRRWGSVPFFQEILIDKLVFLRMNPSRPINNEFSLVLARGTLGRDRKRNHTTASGKGKRRAKTQSKSERNVLGVFAVLFLRVAPFFFSSLSFFLCDPQIQLVNNNWWSMSNYLIDRENLDNNILCFAVEGVPVTRLPIVGLQNNS